MTAIRDQEPVDERVSTGTDTVRALGRIAALLPQLGAAIIGLTTFAYLVGWRREQAYYYQFGAVWIADHLAAGQLLASSALYLFVSSGAAFSAIALSAREGWSARRLQRLASITVAIAALLAAASYLGDGRLPSDVRYGVAFGAAAAWAIASGFALGQLVLLLRESRLSWRLQHVGLLYAAVIFGLWYPPTLLGRALGSFDTDPARSTLPRVRRAAADGDDWRLLAVVEGRIVLAGLHHSGPYPLIRVVQNADTLVFERAGETER